MRAERLKRVKSGCQDCRKRKVRCPEGKYLPQGGREECLMCKRGGVRCFYPQIRPGEGKLVWVPASKCQDPSIQTPSDWTTTSLDHHPIASSSRSTLDIFDIDLNSSEDFINQYLEIDSFLTNNEDEEFNLLARNDRESIIESFQSTEPALSVIEGSNQLPLWQRRAIRALLNPLKSVPKTISQPGITQMTKDQMDVFVVRTFEREGCKDIVSVGHPNRNWIHAFLLPRTEDIFNSCSEIMNKSSFNNPKLGLKQYTFHALMLLSYTCQANMQKNESVAFEATSRAAKHRSLARSIALQLRVRHPASVWQVEEYLLSFFITCMADFLGCQPFQLDEGCNFRLPGPSIFAKSLYGLLNVYKTIHEICTPPDPIQTSKIDLDSISIHVSEDSEFDPWVENFFGFSESIIDCFRNVNQLVAFRTQLLRDDTLNLNKEKFQSILEDLVRKIEQGNMWGAFYWAKGMENRPRRVQRGTMVVCQAIVMIIYSELLQANLQRNDLLQLISQSAIELVADTSVQEMAGYHLMLAIIAIYVPDVKQRQIFLDILTMAQSLSFGNRYKGLFDIVRQCWDIYDEEQMYPSGIAPWRELMAASGVSMCI